MNNIYDDLDLINFIRTFAERTKNGEGNWERVPKDKQFKVLDRAIVHSNIKDPFASQKDDGNMVIVGKYDRKVYYEEDQYFYEDVYFLTFTDNKFTNRTTFSEAAELPLNFQVELGKLHRIIQLKTNNIKNKIDNWFN